MPCWITHNCKCWPGGFGSVPSHQVLRPSLIPATGWFRRRGKNGCQPRGKTRPDCSLSDRRRLDFWSPRGSTFVRPSGRRMGAIDALCGRDRDGRTHGKVSIATPTCFQWIRRYRFVRWRNSRAGVIECCAPKFLRLVDRGICKVAPRKLISLLFA